MTEDRDVSRTRRSLLTTGLATGAAIVAAEVIAPGAANAATGDPVLAGSSVAATATTELDVTNPGGTALDGLLVTNNSAVDYSAAIHGRAIAASGVTSAVVGEIDSSEGSAVVGFSNATTGFNIGVEGDTFSPAAAGVWGWNPRGGSGSVGTADTALPAVSPNTGVYGYSVSPGAAAIGVRGKTASGTGVKGEATTGIAVNGAAGTGTGVYAAAAVTGTPGTALRVVGKARFSRSGRATVLAGSYYVDVTVSGGLASNSVVHATLQTYRPGVAIAAVRTNYPVAGKARIYLTKVASTTSATSVGWFAAEY